MVNPHATSTTEAGLEVIAAALGSYTKLDVVMTEHRGHAATLAADAVAQGIDLVVAHGGDGTVNEIVNGLLVGGPQPGGTALGVVPGGAANVFGAAIGVPREAFDATRQLLHALKAGRRRTIGLGRVRAWGQETPVLPEPAPRWFTFNAGLGLDAGAVRIVEEARARGRKATTARYIRAAIRSFVADDRKPPSLTLHVPGREPVTGLQLAIVANSDPYSYAGSRPVRMNPGVTLDGGLGVFALRRLGTLTVARHAAQILRATGEPHGKHLVRLQDLPSLTITAADPTALQVDGDYLGEHSRAEFEAVPRVLTVVV